MTQLSGAARRKLRAAAGLPKYYPTEQRARMEAHRARRGPRIEILNRIKLERGCADCGYRAHPVALEFDHLPGTIKGHNIARMASGAHSLEAIFQEIKKCEVVCSNCHRIRTYERGRANRKNAAS